MPRTPRPPRLGPSPRGVKRMLTNRTNPGVILRKEVRQAVGPEAWSFWRWLRDWISGA